MNFRAVLFVVGTVASTFKIACLLMVGGACRGPVALKVCHLGFLAPESLHVPPHYRKSFRLYEHRRYKLKLKAAGQFRIKPKTNKSVAKRFKITATGKIMYRRAGRAHLQRKKRHRARTRLSRAVVLRDARMIKKIKSVLHGR